MLVLSRRTNQKVVFPSLGITLSVLKVRGSVVKVGISAPSEVPVLRDEIAENRHDRFQLQSVASSCARRGMQMTSEQRHRLNNGLNVANLALHVTRKQIEHQRTEDATASLKKVIDALDALEREIANVNKSSGAVEKHALVVEDDDNERELTASFLRFCGMEVTTVSDGKEALEVLTSGCKPDFILLDMNMPNCNGVQFLQAVKGKNLMPKNRIFGVSGATPSEFGIDESYVSKWYAKPFDPQVLVSDLTECVN